MKNIFQPADWCLALLNWAVGLWRLESYSGYGKYLVRIAFKFTFLHCWWRSTNCTLLEKNVSSTLCPSEVSLTGWKHNSATFICYNVDNADILSTSSLFTHLEDTEQRCCSFGLLSLAAPSHSFCLYAICCWESVIHCTALQTCCFYEYSCWEQWEWEWSKQW